MEHNNETNKEQSSLVDKLNHPESSKQLNRRKGPFANINKSRDVNFSSFSKNTTEDRLFKAKKVVVNVGDLVDTFFGKLYKIIVSSIITTIFMDNDYFSYLTNPENDENNFFLLREGDYFDINQWDPEATGNKINEEKMQEFVSQLNFFFSTNDIVNIIGVHDKRKRLHIICTILSFALLAASGIVLWRVIDTPDMHIYLIVVFSCMSFLLLVLFGFMIYVICYSNREEEMNYEIFKSLLQHKEMVEDHVQKWNEEYFLEQGIIAYSTSIVNYIHFSKEKDKVYVLANNRADNYS